MKPDLLDRIDKGNRVLNPLTTLSLQLSSNHSFLGLFHETLMANMIPDDEIIYEITMELIRRSVSILNDCSFIVNQSIGNVLKKKEDAKTLVPVILEIIEELNKLPIRPRSNTIRIEQNPNRTLLDDCLDSSINLINKMERARLLKILARNREALDKDIDTIHKNERLNLLLETTKMSELLLDLPIKKFVKENFNEKDDESCSSISGYQDTDSSPSPGSMSKDESSKMDMDDSKVDETSKSNNGLNESSANVPQDHKSNVKTAQPENSLNKSSATSNSDGLNNLEASSFAQLIDLTEEISEDEISAVKDEEPMDICDKSNETSKLSENKPCTSKGIQRSSTLDKKQPKVLEIDSDDSVETIDDSDDDTGKFKFEFPNMEEFLKNKLKKRSQEFYCFNNVWFLRVYATSNDEKRTNHNNNYVRIGLVRKKSTNGTSKADKIQVNFEIRVISPFKTVPDRIEVFKKAIFEGELDTCWCRDRFINNHDLANKFIEENCVMIEAFIKSVRVLS